MPKPEIPSVYQGLPVLTAAQARELDRLATEKHGIAARDLMERAGRAVADRAAAFLRELGRDVAASGVVVCCGRGSNGGDGLVAARALKALGVRVSAFMCPPKKDAGYSELVRANLEAARAAGVTIVEAGEQAGLSAALAEADLAIDALLGTGSSGKPAGAAHHMIQEITRSKKPVLAVDIPSGLHPDTGHHSGVYITAAVTLTFGWAKRGLLAAPAQRYVGTVEVVDIGYPKDLRPSTLGA